MTLVIVLHLEHCNPNNVTILHDNCFRMYSSRDISPDILLK